MGCSPSSPRSFSPKSAGPSRGNSDAQDHTATDQEASTNQEAPADQESGVGARRAGFDSEQLRLPSKSSSTRAFKFGQEPIASTILMTNKKISKMTASQQKIAPEAFSTWSHSAVVEAAMPSAKNSSARKRRPSPPNCEATLREFEIGRIRRAQ